MPVSHAAGLYLGLAHFEGSLLNRAERVDVPLGRCRESDSSLCPAQQSLPPLVTHVPRLLQEWPRAANMSLGQQLLLFGKRAVRKSSAVSRLCPRRLLAVTVCSLCFLEPPRAYPLVRVTCPLHNLMRLYGATGPYSIPQDRDTVTDWPPRLVLQLCPVGRGLPPGGDGAGQPVWASGLPSPGGGEGAGGK